MERCPSHILRPQGRIKGFKLNTYVKYYTLKFKGIERISQWSRLIYYKGFTRSYYGPLCKAEQTINGKPD